jgi:indole-3-glycerol phosphate synthase
MPDIATPLRLKPLIARRQGDVDKIKAKRSADSLTQAIAELAPARGFAAALRAHFYEQKKLGVIADICGASPFSKVMRSRCDVMALAGDFRDAGAICISASPDKRLFRGGIADLATAKSADLPVLSNDLVVDPYQILEARHAGADAVVLMVNVIGDRLGAFIAQAESAGLDAFVEVRNEPELEVALEAGAGLIAVNNRDAETLEADLAVCEKLVPGIAREARTVVAAGGISSPDDIARMAAAGAHAVRIGGALMAAKEPFAELQRLLGTVPTAAD